MNRCIRSRTASALVSCALLSGFLLTLPLSSSAQGIIREAPRDVRPGLLVVTQSPVITLDGKPDRLSPGSRIRDLNNMLVLSAGITGKEIPVVYRRDPSGLVHEVWMLTPEEYRKLGGANANDPEGYKRFAELLALIFSLRK